MSRTAAERLFGDERVARARALILEALADHQGRLDGVRPADPERAIAYQELLASFERQRGRPLFHRFLGSGFGRGVLVEMGDGSVKYDLMSGIGVHGLGHGHPAMVAAALDAALGDIIMQGAFHQNVESEAASRALIACASRGGAALEHCFFATSGAMANENALKIALQKRAPAHRLLAFHGCFAGRTLMLSHVSDTPAYRDGLPDAVPVDYVPFYDPARPADSANEALAALDRHLSAHPGAHAAMMFELIQGEAGYHPGSREFFVPIMQRLREHGIAVVVDEIQTFGRTTEPFAFQYYGLDSLVDIVTVGKLSQVCATLYTAAWNPRPGLISGTFTGSTAALMALGVVLDALTHGGVCGAQGTIARLHERFASGLEALARELPGEVTGPWGIGSMIAFTVFDGSADRTRQFVHALFERGVIGFITTGARRVRFHLPAGAMTVEDVDAVIAIIRDTVIACRAS